MANINLDMKHDNALERQEGHLAEEIDWEVSVGDCRRAF